MPISRTPSSGLAAVERISEEFRTSSKGEPTNDTYHIAVRAKFTTETVGSSAIIGINCVLHGQAYHQSNDMPSNFQRMGEDDSLRGAAVAQHADALSTEVDVMPPARRMENLALERPDALQLWDSRHDQHADGRHEGRRMRQPFLARTHVARLNTPHIRICIPLGLVDRRVKPTVGAQAVLVDDAVHIFQNFRLRGDRSIPVRFRVCGEGVEVDWDVGAASLE
jgi:hypothetical protein